MCAIHKNVIGSHILSGLPFKRIVAATAVAVAVAVAVVAFVVFRGGEFLLRSC